VVVPFWERIAIVAGVVLGSAVLAKLIDIRMGRKQLAPGAETRYRVLRRSIMFAIVLVALLSGLLIIPQVRAVAGALLASSAILGLVIGFASQRTLANFAAGLLIAFTQPLRLGDRIAVDGVEGVVEEIGLTFTFLRADDETRLVVPNEKLASDTIKNSTIVSPKQRAEITVQVPLSSDLDTVLDLLRGEVAGEREPDVFLSGLDGNATVTLRAAADNPLAADRLEHDLRLRVHERLRTAGIWS
jgi:small-conductance mechanosensitive channel